MAENVLEYTQIEQRDWRLKTWVRRGGSVGTGTKMQPSAKDVAQAVKPKPLVFGLTLQNIPTINLRHQYVHDRELVFADGLADKIHAWKFGQTAGATVTYPEPDGYFTVLFRSTIVGIECTLQMLAMEELLFSNRLTKPLEQLIRHPSRLGKSMADAYYNRIPEQVDVNAGLKTRNKDLWKIVLQFYTEVRNPLSHGYQLSDVKEESIRGAFGMFDQVYSWIDSWSDPHRVQRILASTTFQMLK